MNRILVTGGAGFIGSHLVQAIAARGDQVVIVDNLNEFYSRSLKLANLDLCLRSNLVKHYLADIGDGVALNDIFSKEKPTAVVHLAASAGVRRSLSVPQEYMQNNLTAFVTLLEVLARHEVRKLIFASSSSVYGGVSSVPYCEDGPVDPLSPYAVTKLAGEQLCKIYAVQHGFDCVSMRFFSVYGPRQRPDMAIARFADLILSGLPLPINGSLELARDYTYIDDVVLALIAALNKETSNVVLNIGRSNPVTLRQVTKLLSEALDREVILEMRPLVKGEPRITWANISLARHILGYKPTINFEEGLGRFIAWRLEHESVWLPDSMPATGRRQPPAAPAESMHPSSLV